MWVNSKKDERWEWCKGKEISSIDSHTSVMDHNASNNIIDSQLNSRDDDDNDDDDNDDD